MFVGVGASRVRDLFKKARERAPSIIFIDELDSVAGTRKSIDPSHSRDTVNQILSEMDGFKQSDNVIVIGATNLDQAIDPAIKRPGRFDKIINVPLPDIRGREEIFKYYLKNITYNNQLSPKELARQTSGFSGADIQNMVNIAILNAIKNSTASPLTLSRRPPEGQHGGLRFRTRPHRDGYRTEEHADQRQGQTHHRLPRRRTHAGRDPDEERDAASQGF